MRRSALLVCAAAAVAALGLPSAGDASAAKSVTVKNFAFSPSTVTARHGTKITWKFRDSTTHNVTVKRGPRKFHSRDIRRGNYSKVVTAKGTYKLICTIHPDMHMTLKVT